MKIIPDEEVRTRMSGIHQSLCLIAVAMLAASSASAHVTLENRQATVGTYYSGIRRAHGCAGSATVRSAVCNTLSDARYRR